MGLNQIDFFDKGVCLEPGRDCPVLGQERRSDRKRPACKVLERAMRERFRVGRSHAI